MGLGWRRRKGSGNKKKLNLQATREELEIEIPKHFLCPISLELMKDPVTLSSGMTYDRESVETWLEAGNFTCPVTNLTLQSFDQIPNHTLREMIQEWCMQNQKYGIQRIPTPRVPVVPIEVSEILFAVAASARRLDLFGCLESVRKIQNWGCESERNRRCVVANGAVDVLSAAFDVFSKDSYMKNVLVCEEILSALNWMFPIGKEASKYLGSEASLNCMVWLLKGNDLPFSAKKNSILVLEELLSCDQAHVEALAKIEGVPEILIDFIIKNISPMVTKASLMLIFHLFSSPSTKQIKSKFLDMDLVSLVLEILVESEKGISEKALRVFDGVCGYETGREKAYDNALTIPVLVKKLLRVSNGATEFSVSSIWKLCKFAKNEEERVLVEALQVGAFQKLLLIIQVGCGDETKEKATELLKLLNPYRPQLECIESVDFKSLQRSF